MNPQIVVQVLAQYLGSNNGIRTSDLVQRITGQRSTKKEERYLRQIIRELREEGWPICGSPETGYYWAENPEDVVRTCALLRARAMSSLGLIGKLKRLALPSLLGQLSLFPELSEPKIPEVSEKDYSRIPRVALNIHLPIPLYELFQKYIEESGGDREKILAEVLSLFLIEEGLASAVQIYKELKESDDATA